MSFQPYVIGLCCLLWAAPGLGQTRTTGRRVSQGRAGRSAQDAEARTRYAHGKRLYEAGRFHEAAAEFDAAYRLSGRPALLYNLYVACREAGDLPCAITALRGYLEKYPHAPDRVNLQARLQAMELAQARQAGGRPPDGESSRPRPPVGRPQPGGARPRTVNYSRPVVGPLILGAAGTITVGVVGVVALTTGCVDEYPSGACRREKDLNTVPFILYSAAGVAAIGGAFAWYLLGEKAEPTRPAPRARVRAGLGGLFVEGEF